jgi:hypothetical protein
MNGYVELPGWVAEVAFPSTVTFYDPFTINFYYSLNSGPWEDAGASSNQLYVTYAQAKVSGDSANPYLYHTPIHISTKAAAGQSDPGVVLTKIWEEFADTRVNRVADGAALKYYGAWNTSNTTTGGLLKDADGQCRAWARFFADTYKAQGIDYENELVTVLPGHPAGGVPDANYFLVNRWSFGSTGHADLEPGWTHFNIENPPLRGMIGTTWVYRWRYSQVSDLLGDDGQGPTANPDSLFGNHCLVKIGATYYDPSYGKTYTSVAHFEASAVAGFAKAPIMRMVDEAGIGIDLNSNGIMVPTLWPIYEMRTNPGGQDMEELPPSNY